MRRFHELRHRTVTTAVVAIIVLSVATPLASIAAASAAPMHPGVTTPTIKATPPSGAPGSPVAVTGSGWAPSTRVFVSFRDSTGVKTHVGSAMTDANGMLSVNVMVPAGAAKGVGRFNGKDRTSLQHANVKFTVT
jgi:hypothetical protein